MRDNLLVEKKEDTEVKDKFKYFPIGYLLHMYFVLSLCRRIACAENILSIDAFHKRSISHYRDEESRKRFHESRDDGIVNLPTTKDIGLGAHENLELRLLVHLCELIDSNLIISKE